MQQLARVLVLIVACAVHALHCMECEPNQNEQSTSFFETSGDLSLTGLFDVYDEKCSGPTPTGIHSMEMVVTVVQILNSIHYVPDLTLGLTLYEVCSHRNLDIQKALISFAVAQYCNNSTTPIAVYTTEDVRTKIASSPAAVGLDVPVYTAGPIVDVDAHAESAVEFLTTNGVGVADLLVAQDADVARRFERVAAANGLCLNDTVLAPDFGDLNDSFIVIIMANRDVINSILESNVRVSHFIIVPLDGPLPPKPEFEDGSYVFQAYGGCPPGNATAGTVAEQAVSAQFVQTAADVLRALDAYTGGDCGNASAAVAAPPTVATRCERSTTTKTAAVAVEYGAEAFGRVLDRLSLLDGGEYNVTLVHVTEYGGGGGTVGAYVQGSDGARRLEYTGPQSTYPLASCDTCPACVPPPTTTPTPTPEPADPTEAVPLVTWKQDVWIASALTVCAVGALCAACIGAFVVVRVCKKDVLEGNPTHTFVLMAGTLLTYGSAVPFAVDGTAYPQAVCYAKVFGTSTSCALVFAAMLARSAMIAACDAADTGFMSHVNGYVQAAVFAFAAAVQLALAVQFAGIQFAVLPAAADLCRRFVRGPLFLAALSYDAVLLALLCAVAPLAYRSRRNYREGACFAVAAYASLAVWLCWGAAHVALPARWSDLCAVVGLTGTATAVVVAVFIPRTYMMTFGIVRERIAGSSSSSLHGGYGYGGGGCRGYNPGGTGYYGGRGRGACCDAAAAGDVHCRSTQALYDSVMHAPPAERGQSNPNYYSPAGSRALPAAVATAAAAAPRSRPLTPVNEYDVPPRSPGRNRITRF